MPQARRGVRIHVQDFIHRHSQKHRKNTGGVKQQQTGMARTRHKSSPVSGQGRLAANVIQGAKQREIIQVHYNNPGRGRVQTTRQERNPRQTKTSGQAEIRQETRYTG